MHPFSTLPKTSQNVMVFWCFQGVEKECIGNEWVKVENAGEKNLYLVHKIHWLFHFSRPINGIDPLHFVGR